MMYLDFVAGNNNYKLRLNTRNVIVLEKQLGGNPLSIFGNGDKLPSITNLVAILHCALQQFQHNITLNDAYDIFDAYLADGHTMTDFIQVVVDLYKLSGIIGEGKEKN